MSAFKYLLFTLKTLPKHFRELRDILLILSRWENRSSQIKYLIFIFKDMGNLFELENSF